MDKISKGFVGRTVRAVLFIILIIVFCTAISSAGIYLASRYGLTQSREQVPLTALYLGNEGKVELPGRGKMVEGKGWRLRNSRDSYTLTLDNAVIENTVMKNTVMESTESSPPAIDITGDLTIELKEGSGSWIRSEGAGIRIHSGTLVIRGKGSLDIEARTAGILGNRTENSQAALRLEGGHKGNVCGNIMSGGGYCRWNRYGFSFGPMWNRYLFMQNQSGRIRRGDDGRGQRCSGAGRRQRGDEAIHKVRWKSDGRTRRCPGCGV